MLNCLTCLFLVSIKISKFAFFMSDGSLLLWSGQKRMYMFSSGSSAAMMSSSESRH